MLQIRIDLEMVAAKLMGKPVENTYSHEISRDTRLFRFNDDELHVLVDGGGGFRAIAHPDTAQEETIAEGSLQDYPEAISTLH